MRRGPCALFIYLAALAESSPVHWALLSAATQVQGEVLVCGAGPGTGPDRVGEHRGQLCVEDIQALPHVAVLVATIRLCVCWLRSCRLSEGAVSEPTACYYLLRRSLLVDPTTIVLLPRHCEQLSGGGGLLIVLFREISQPKGSHIVRRPVRPCDRALLPRHLYLWRSIRRACGPIQHDSLSYQ